MLTVLAGIILTAEAWDPELNTSVAWNDVDVHACVARLSITSEAGNVNEMDKNTHYERPALPPPQSRRPR